MSLWSKLFGGEPSAPVEPKREDYKDFRIFAAPISEGGTYRVAARIEKGAGDGVKTHQMIRADTCQSLEEAERITVLKAKAMIDQLGETIFD